MGFSWFPHSRIQSFLLLGDSVRIWYGFETTAQDGLFHGKGKLIYAGNECYDGEQRT